MASRGNLHMNISTIVRGQALLIFGTDEGFNMCTQKYELTSDWGVNQEPYQRHF
jgi:hypothetical protein